MRERRDVPPTATRASQEVRPDRLSALVGRFRLTVRACENSGTNLLILGDSRSGLPTRIIFAPSPIRFHAGQNTCRASDAHEARSSCDVQDVSEVPEARAIHEKRGERGVIGESHISLFKARVDWGGEHNPLISALPSHMDMSLDDNTELQSLASLLVGEWQESRCGSASVVNRLGEVLLVRLLRSLLAAGTADVGLLAGLADDRLCHAIVAIHEQPGRQWSVDMLADIAGLSTSRFAGRFSSIVGQSPMVYLRHWRMILAHQDLRRGERVQIVADRYGYTSGEALARAFRRQFGHKPTELRHR